MNPASWSIWAADGPEAMRMIQASAGAFDLVVLDLTLPGMDGLRILTWMRQSVVHVPVLIRTAKDSMENRVWNSVLTTI